MGFNAQRFAKRLDKIRTRIPGSFGLRGTTLTVRTVFWSGDMAGEGEQTATEKVISGPNGQPYKVSTVSTKDIAASGGLFTAGQLKVGPMTPPYAGGGWTADDIDPPNNTAQPIEILYKLEDPSSGVQWCTKGALDKSNPLHWYLTLNPNGVQP